MILTPDEATAIKRQAVEEYPNECCGVILTRGDERRLLRFRNIQDELHARDPLHYPRTARNAYSVGVRELRVMDELIDSGFRLFVMYHSHPDAGAYFSPTDAAHAAPPPAGDALYPETTYVVVSVLAGAAVDMAAFRWDPATRTFPPVELHPMEASR